MPRSWLVALGLLAALGCGELATFATMPDGPAGGPGPFPVARASVGPEAPRASGGPVAPRPSMRAAAGSVPSADKGGAVVAGPLPGKEVWAHTIPMAGVGVLRQSVRDEGTRFVWYFESQATADCTISPSVERTNMDAEPFDAIQVVPAGKTVVVARFAVVDPEKAYRYYTDARVQVGHFRAEPDGYVYGLPWPEGVKGEVWQGWHGAFSHTGEAAYAVDIPLPEGTAVRAARDGVVIATNAAATRGGTTKGFRELDQTNFIYVRHADGTHARYLHLMPGGVLVAAGQAVERGEVIGKSGNTGFSTAPHLHFEISAPVDGKKSRSFPFHWLVDSAKPAGEVPEQGRTYTPAE